jgi:glycogen(starch) synthase
MINYEYPPLGGGAATASCYVARELIHRGHSVNVLTSHLSGLGEQENREGVNIIRIQAWRRHISQSNVSQMIAFMISAFWQGKKIIKRTRPEAVLAFFSIPGGPIAWWFKKRYGIPYVVSLRGGDVPGAQEEQLWLWHKLAKPIIRIVWKEAFRVVANSEGLAKLAYESASGLNLQINAIPNGVDLARFSPPESRAQREEVALLFAGRASREKNVPEVLEALAKFKERRWRFSIVADGPEMKGWRRRAQQVGLQDRVMFKGWLPKDKMEEIYRETDVLVFPSTSEGMPNVVLEAMASGLPVIATRIRGTEDLVEDGICGFLYEPGDVVGLGELLEKIFDKGTRERMGKASRRRAEKFSWAETAMRYQDILLEALKR